MGKFAGGLAGVQIDDTWGYIDRSGTLAIEPRFDSAYRFTGGLAVVKMNGRAGYINRDGKFVWGPPSVRPVKTDSPITFTCSDCFVSCLESEIHVVPRWNEEAEAFLCAHCCEECWREVLNETKKRVEQIDEEIRDGFGFFLRGQDRVSLAETVESQPPERAKVTIRKFLTRLAEGKEELQY